MRTRIAVTEQNLAKFEPLTFMAMSTFMRYLLSSHSRTQDNVAIKLIESIANRR